MPISTRQLAVRRLCTYVLAAAIASRASLAVGAQAGDLDPTFNGGQPLLVDVIRTIPRGTVFSAVAFDPAGNLLITGNATDGDGRTAVVLVRVTASGVLDTSFASAGSQVLSLGLGTMPFSSASSIAPHAGGGWLLAGGTTDTDGRGALLTAALDNNGILDGAYGSGGVVRSQPASAPQSSYASRADVTSDGSVLFAGTIQVDGVTTSLAVARVTYDGFPDADFGNQGAKGAFVGSFSQSATTPTTMGGDVIVTPDGILVSGQTADSLGRPQVLLVRLTPAGALDPQFGSGGVVRHQAADPSAVPRDSNGTAIAVASGGKIYVAGNARNADNAYTFAVSRFTADGLVDGSFGTNGTRRLQPAPGTNPAFLSDVVVQPDGKVLLLGSVRIDAATNQHELVLLRLQPEGDLDGSFGGTGVLRIRIGDTGAGRAILSPDAASVVVTGVAVPGSVANGLVARVLLAAPTTTTTLPAGCTAAPSVAGAACRIGRIADGVGTAVPSGKVQRRLLRVLRAADERMAAAETLNGRPLRRTLRKAAARMRRVGRLLLSKAATRAIDDAERTGLVTITSDVTNELEALVGA